MRAPHMETFRSMSYASTATSIPTGKHRKDQGKGEFRMHAGVDTYCIGDIELNISSTGCLALLTFDVHRALRSTSESLVQTVQAPARVWHASHLTSDQASMGLLAFSRLHVQHEAFTGSVAHQNRSLKITARRKPYTPAGVFVNPLIQNSAKGPEDERQVRASSGS